MKQLHLNGFLRIFGHSLVYLFHFPLLINTDKFNVLQNTEDELISQNLHETLMNFSL